ncbi:MAG: ribonuclease HII [Leptospira sp.]|nr:ribonuclease HII [Leptospira sp.]
MLRLLPLRRLLQIQPDLNSNNSKFLTEELNFDPDKEICGVDEAGRGPLAGPLSLSMVYYSREALGNIFSGTILTELNDSKKLTAKTRERLYPEIHSHASGVFHQFVSNNFIDQFGLTYSIFYGIDKMVSRSKLKAPFLLIDGNYNFSKFNPKWKYQSIIKGDTKVASIASASIIAKVKRDSFMTSLNPKFPNYDFSSHKGYGTKKHLKEIETSGYSKIHRKSFLIKNPKMDHGI